MNTFFALLAEYGTSQIPLDRVSSIFGLSPKEAEKRACLQKLPVPAFRAGTQKSPWLVDAGKLASYLDDCKARAEADWRKMQSVS